MTDEVVVLWLDRQVYVYPTRFETREQLARFRQPRKRNIKTCGLSLQTWNRPAHKQKVKFESIAPRAFQGHHCPDRSRSNPVYRKRGSRFVAAQISKIHRIFTRHRTGMHTL